MKADVCIVIPTLNPEESILSLVREIIRLADCPVIAVDDGSRPEKAELFVRLSAIPGVELLRHDRNYGKGKALRTAFKRILEEYPECVGAVTADGDGQHLPADVAACAEELLKHPDSLVLGVRDFSGEKIPWKSRLGNRLTGVVWRLVLHAGIKDTQTGLRGIPGFFQKILLGIPGDRFEFETSMLIEAGKRRIPIIQKKIVTVYEDSNRGTHFRPFSDSWKIYSVILKSFFRRT